jgi:hypothetical protein
MLLFFVPVGYSIWLPGPIICSDWLKFQRSSSLKFQPIRAYYWPWQPIIAAKENSVDKWYTYDQQFRLRVSKDDTKKWSSIDVFLWCISNIHVYTNNYFFFINL